MKRLFAIIFAACLPVMLAAQSVYYVATTGSDDNDGSIDSPFATLTKAIKTATTPGDTVYIREGIYYPQLDDYMSFKESKYYCAFYFDNSGGGEDSRICYMGYPGERPVFDMSNFEPTTEGMRVAAFYVYGSYLHFRNFEVIGTQAVYSSSNTQSECFRHRRGDGNVYENLSMHDGEAIGFYLAAGGGNLVLNCDAYNNYDTNSAGNVDGFGCHPNNASYTGNVFRGCRAWYNSDDGFDLISAFAAVTIDQCWAFYNGYKPDTFSSAGDGNGFKAGGYGMGTLDDDGSDYPDTIPMHVVTNCIAYRNKSGGVYSNHHLGGVRFANNTSFYNRYNYNMCCRKSVDEATNVDGYDHVIRNNVSYEPRERHTLYFDDYSACTVDANSFLFFTDGDTSAADSLDLSANDFESLDPSELTADRYTLDDIKQLDDDAGSLVAGSLPAISFLVPTASSELTAMGIGWTVTAPESDDDLMTEDAEDTTVDGVLTEDDWLMEPVIVVDGDSATIEGPDADLFTKFFIDGTSVKISKGAVDLTGYSGTLELKATNNTSGGIIKLTITR